MLIMVNLFFSIWNSTCTYFSPSDGSLINVSKRLDSVGSIRISVRRRSADIEYFKSKKKKIESTLSSLIGTIERLNQVHQSELRTVLTSNVRGISGITLLHAAVELMTDQSLIDRLLRLGADPRRRPTMFQSCSLDLAQRQYDRCREKAKTALNDGRPRASVKAQDRKCIKAKRLLDMLQNFRR